jgi:hypothetical protein
MGRMSLGPGITRASWKQRCCIGLKAKQMIKPTRSAEQQVADEANRRGLNPTGSRQTISDSQAAPEFQENLKRLKAERLRREARPKVKPKA